MTKKLLNGADVVAQFQQVRGEGMAQGVTSDALGELCRPGRPSERPRY